MKAFDIFPPYPFRARATCSPRESRGWTAIGKPNADALFLKPGDIVECGIEGMMTLRTHIMAPA